MITPIGIDEDVECSSRGEVSYRILEVTTSLLVDDPELINRQFRGRRRSVGMEEIWRRKHMLAFDDAAVIGISNHVETFRNV